MTAGAVWPAAASTVGAFVASLLIQLPPSVASSGRAAAVMSEAEKTAACTELKGMATALQKDAGWMREPFSARELQQIQKVRESLGCPTDEGGWSGAWRIESPAGPGLHAVTGRMTLKRIDTALGLKRSQENWGSFTLRNECAGSEEFYLSTDLTWDPDSFFIKDYFLWGAPTGTGSLLMCDDHGHFEGRFRANFNDGLGELVKLGPYNGTLDGQVLLMAGRGPSTVPFVAKRSGR